MAKRLPTDQEMLVMDYLIGGKEMSAVDLIVAAAETENPFSRNSIYTVLMRMVARGYLADREETKRERGRPGPPRRLYKITAFGQKMRDARLSIEQINPEPGLPRPFGTKRLIISFFQCLVFLIAVVQASVSHSEILVHWDQLIHCDDYYIDGCRIRIPTDGVNIEYKDKDQRLGSSLLWALIAACCFVALFFLGIKDFTFAYYEARQAWYNEQEVSYLLNEKNRHYVFYLRSLRVFFVAYYCAINPFERINERRHPLR